MRTFLAAAVLWLGAGLSDAGAADWPVRYRAYYCPAYTLVSVPVYYAPVVYAPVRLRPLGVPNLAIPTAAPPSQTKEPPVAPGQPEKSSAPPKKTERPPELGTTSFYRGASPALAAPPVLSGETLRPDALPPRR